MDIHHFTHYNYLDAMELYTCCNVYLTLQMKFHDHVFSYM